MSVTRVSAPLLAALVGVCCAAYYAVVAFAPGRLAGRVAGIPVSVLLAVALFMVFFAVTLLYTWAAPAERDQP